MDEFDRASEIEAAERELRIAAARNRPKIVPDLGCRDCKNIAYVVAKESCEDFKNCLADWQKIERISQIKGKQDA